MIRVALANGDTNERDVAAVVYRHSAAVLNEGSSAHGASAGCGAAQQSGPTEPQTSDLQPVNETSTIERTPPAFIKNAPPI